MAMSFQQRRKLSITIGVLFAVGVVAFIMWKPISDAFIAPDGYAVHVPAGNFTHANWSDLMKATKQAGAQAVIPANVKALDGQAVAIHGYLLPLHSGVDSNQFFLAPKPGNCYFCNPPGIGEAIEINVAGGKRLPLSDRPVSVYGKFRVTDGVRRALYIVDDATLSLRS